MGLLEGVFPGEHLFFVWNSLFRVIGLPFEQNAAYSGRRAVVFYGHLSGALAPVLQGSVELPQTSLFVEGGV